DLVERVIVLDRAGGIAADGPPRAIFEHQAERLERVGIWQPAASRLAQRLRARGVWLELHPLTAAEAGQALTAAGVGPEIVLQEASPAPAPTVVEGPPALAIEGLSFAFGERQVLT